MQLKKCIEEWVFLLSAFCFFAFWFVPSLLLSVFICGYSKKRAATGIAALPFVLLGDYGTSALTSVDKALSTLLESTEVTTK
jgi:hypothetical protein